MEPSRWNFNEENEDLMIAIRRCIAFRCIRWIFVIAGEIFNKLLSVGKSSVSDAFIFLLLFRDER